MAERIGALQEATEITTKRIEMERRKNEDLSKKIEISRKKLEESRAKMRGVDDTSEMRARGKAVKTAEHRLDVIMSKLNQINKQNEGTRGTIESLRRDKIQRQRIVWRLQREVAETKKKLEQCGTDAAAASEARDKADREIGALQATIQREAAQFEAEFTARIEHFTKQSAERRATEKEENAATADVSASQSLLKAPPIHGALGGLGDEQVGSMTVEQEIELKHKSTRTWWEIARREVEVKEQSAKLAHLEDAFAKIQEETGIQTIDEMVTAFVQTEDRNYSVLMMINDLNREIETAEVENASLRAAVDGARSRGHAGQASRDKLYKEWEAQIKGMHRRAAAYDRQYEHALRSLDAIKPGVHSIFQKLGNDTALAESLAAAGVTDTNIMQHLGLIEQRVSELMHLYELSAHGVPLTLPTEEEEAAAAIASAAASEAGTTLSRSTSPRMTFEVEISRVGGIGASDGTFRSRRAVVAAPVPPSLADLEESSDEDEHLGTSGIPSHLLAARKGSLTRGRRGSGAGNAKSAADDAAAAAAAAEVDMSEPLDLTQLRQLTSALVERKQAKAERRERAAEATRASGLGGDASPIAAPAAVTSLSTSIYTRTPVRGSTSSGGAAARSSASVSPSRTPAAIRPISRSSAGSSPIRTPRRRDGEEGGFPADGAAAPAAGEEAAAATGGVMSIMPRPPSQPSSRNVGARPAAPGRRV